MAKALRKPKASTETPKRLTPKAEILRELYLLSGNRCAMTGCKNVIIDDKGAVIGQVCHIEAAMPDGPRFNPLQTNDERRAISNLVLICAGHHIQIDSVKHENEWPLEKVRRLKAEHEAKFKAIPGSLEQRFTQQFTDSTDSLDPTDPGAFIEFEKLGSEYRLAGAEKKQRAKETREYLKKMAKIPDRERQFMLAVIKRAIKTESYIFDAPSLHVDDVHSALDISHSKLKSLGKALERHQVGDLTEVSTPNGEEWHVRIWNPSDELTWADLSTFCDRMGRSLDEFVIHLKFGLLDG